MSQANNQPPKTTTVAETAAPAGHSIEPITSELTDQEAPLDSYEILTYPADYPLEVLVAKWRKQEIVIPTFQRHFVWSQDKASRLVDSFLKGLPVPSIFLFADLTSNELLVVDGHQRIQSIAYFYEGYFGPETSRARKVFRLTGLEDASPFAGLTFQDLKHQDPSAFTKLNNSVLRAFIIRQLHPDDDTSIYHVFERLNTGSTLLFPQEIRNCVHHGPFNDMLNEVNLYPPWRAIFGRELVDKRQRDVELILRFLALTERISDYKKPMKKFLNQYMKTQRAADSHELARLAKKFKNTADKVLDVLGEKPFHIKSGLNAAVFDCTFVAVDQHIDRISENYRQRYRNLVIQEKFLKYVTSGTTDKEVLLNRMKLAHGAILG